MERTPPVTPDVTLPQFSSGAHVLLVTNGAVSVPPQVFTQLSTADTTLVIAVDGGIGAVMAAGIRPDHLLGDFDSANRGAIEGSRAHGAVVHQLPTDKDATDLEFALELAMQLTVNGFAIRGVTVVSGHGDRFDHLLAEAALLASTKWRHVTVDAIYAPATVTVMWGPSTRVFDTAPNDLITVLPMHAAATVSISGVRWELRHATLEPGSTHGVSNEAKGLVSVSVHQGCALIIRPFGLGNPS
jgi:thiamine pyrophosphokinase